MFLISNLKMIFSIVSLFNEVDANCVVEAPLSSYHLVEIFEYFRFLQLNLCYFPHRSSFLYYSRNPVYVEQSTQSQLKKRKYQIEEKYFLFI